MINENNSTSLLLVGLQNNGFPARGGYLSLYKAACKTTMKVVALLSALLSESLTVSFELA